MSDPKFPLGVDLMDEDHAHLETLMENVKAVPDAELPAYLDTLIEEIGAHFAREEALMREARVPVLECHIAQHARLIGDVEGVRARIAEMGLPALRSYMGRELPGMVMAHVASVDQISARFLVGDLDSALVSRLRLPEKAAE